MRTVLAAATLLAVTTSVAVATEPSICQPNPLSHTHPSWVQVPNTTVDLRGPSPASATNPLMVGPGWVLAAVSAAPAQVSQPVDPLTHRP